MVSSFTQEVVRIIKSIPYGKVMTYGAVAAFAGSPRGARQVVRILHTQSKKHSLPWHRIINSKGMISMTMEGYLEQRTLLEDEGVEFDENNKIDLEKYMWDGTT